MQNIIKYSNDERTILSVSDVDSDLFNHAGEELQIAGDELLRMENEGGTSLTPKQTANIRAYAKIRKRIEAILFSKETQQNRKDS